MAVTITRTDHKAADADTTTDNKVATYSNVSIGDAHSDRIVAVCAAAGGVTNCAVNSCTIDYGSGDVEMSAGSTTLFGSYASRIFYLAVPSGTTATIKVTYGVALIISRNRIAVYDIAGGEFSATGTDSSTDMDSSDPVTTGSITIPTNGGFLGVLSNSNPSFSVTWSNATNDINQLLSFRFSTAYSTTAGSTTITAYNTVNSTDGSLGYVIFTPAAAVTALPRRALDGPVYGSLRGSIR